MLSVYHCLFQVAERQGRYLAKALSHEPTKDCPEPKPFVFKSQGMLAYIGDYRALTDTPKAKLQGTLQAARWYNSCSYPALSQVFIPGYCGAQHTLLVSVAGG